MAGHSTVLIAKRAFVKLLLRLAVAYHVVISVNRDSPDPAVQAAFRKVVLKVGRHPAGLVQWMVWPVVVWPVRRTRPSP